MNKIGIVVGLSFFLAGCQWPGGLGKMVPNQQPGESVVESVKQVKQMARVVIEMPVPVEVETAVDEGATALTLLQVVAMQNNIEVAIKEYDFGTMVEGIGKQTNNSERAWIYFVNGESAAVGAGDYAVNPGDVIEWKYIEPIF